MFIENMVYHFFLYMVLFLKIRVGLFNKSVWLQMVGNVE